MDPCMLRARQLLITVLSPIMKDGVIILPLTVKKHPPVIMYPLDFCLPTIVNIVPHQRQTKRAVLFALYLVIQSLTALKPMVSRGHR
jgi:hypothetical protein